MGLVPPSDGFLSGLRDLCSRQGILLIFDEVISGFRASAAARRDLRDSPGFSRVSARSSAADFPSARTAAAPTSWNWSLPPAPVYQAGTLSGNPIAMTAGIWALERLSPKLYKDLARAARSSLQAGGRGPRRESPAPGERLRLASDAVLQLRSGARLRLASIPIRPLRDVLSRHARARVYPPPSQFEAWFLSAAHSDRDVKKTIAARGSDEGRRRTI
jgi:glutamate-1-semialdehyde 2,1-aminomutase